MKGLASFSLTAAVCFLLTAISSYGQTTYRISEPVTYKNLTIFLIHGADASSNKDLITLEEALRLKVFKVYETEDVNELMVENISPKYDVFIQSGDIVKGGKQDRVLAVSVIIPRNSGKVSIEAFCVESDRWEGRGNESRKEFSSSEERVVSKELKLATNGVVTVNGARSSAGTGSGSGSGNGAGNGSGSVELVAPPPATDGTRTASEVVTVAGRGSQTEVWKEVANSQRNINANVMVDVTANSSASSLQLSLENKKLVKERESFAEGFADLAKGKNDVIGYAFAINGKINSADIYVSNHLFTKLWPKMLKAAVVEAISLSDKPAAATQPGTGDINAFLLEAEKGAVKERPTVARSKVVTRQASNEVVYEARDRSDIVVHRNYVKLN